MEKYLFGEAKTRNLIQGIIALFIAIALILWGYGYFSGMTSAGEDLVLKREGIASLFGLQFVTLLLGLSGGFEIGRYVQTEFTKRRKEKLLQKKF